MIISSLIQQIHKKWFNVQQRTNLGFKSAKDTVFRGGLIIICGILTIWISIFLYTAFYYAYMPSMTYVRPVHLQFESCVNLKHVCSYPSGYIELTKKQRLLMVGQPYRINLQIEMPESPANKELGMFMVCAELRSRNNVLVEHSCRSAMLHYRSTLLHMLTTLTFSPMMIFGTIEEKQNIVLELFGNFEEDQSYPVTVIYVEIQSRDIELYSATIMINAHLSGLRYLMFHWPVLSAIVGISTNLFFIVLICILSYLHFTSEEENFDDTFNYEQGENKDDSNLTLTSDYAVEWLTAEDSSLVQDSSYNESPTLIEADPASEKSSYIEEIQKKVD